MASAEITSYKPTSITNRGKPESDHFRLVDHPSRIIGRRRAIQASVNRSSGAAIDRSLTTRPRELGRLSKWRLLVGVL